MLEGIGRFYPAGHPEQGVVVHGGEMAMMTVDGQIMRPTKFNAALVYKTSKLITSFPTLPNADLILAVIAQSVRHREWHSHQYRSDNHHKRHNQFRKNLSRSRSGRSAAHLAWQFAVLLRQCGLFRQQ
jgi:ribosomal protein L21